MIRFDCGRCGYSHDLESVRRSLYVGQRSIADYEALKRGRLGRRLARRSVTRRLMRSLWR